MGDTAVPQNASRSPRRPAAMRTGKIRIISSAGPSPLAQLLELWDSRELVVHFTIRDLKLRYKQTLIGVAWAIVQPVMTMIVFTLFFGRLAKMPSEGLPYPVFYFSALLPWIYFSSAVTQGANALVGNQNVIKKVYFPRLALILSSVAVGLLDLLIGLALLLVALPFYDIPLTPKILWLIPLILLALLSALSVSIWLSVLNALYRDIKHVLPFLIQLWMFISPVAYATSLVPERWRSLYALNPLVTIIDGFRWSLTGQGAIDSLSAGLSTVMVVALLVAGMIFFAKSETTMVDVL